MTPEQQSVIDELRDEGYCVVLWTPEELRECDIGHLEDIVISRGNEFIENTGNLISDESRYNYGSFDEDDE
jgi:hypothetical protein